MKNDQPTEPAASGRREQGFRSKDASSLCPAVPQREATPGEPDTLGVPWSALRCFRSRLAELPMPHEYVLPFAVFLGGLTLAATDQLLQHAPHRSVSQDALVEAARETLRDAVEFALQEEAQTLVRSDSKIPGDTAYQCLFMGVAYTQANHTTRTHAWLTQGDFQDNLTRLLLAMGMLAWKDPQARRLTRKIRANLHALTEENLGREVARLLGELKSEVALGDSGGALK